MSKLKCKVIDDRKRTQGDRFLQKGRGWEMEGGGEENADPDACVPTPHEAWVETLLHMWTNTNRNGK